MSVQAPEATRVAGYRAWQSLGRQVKKGERGIRIWAPSRRRERDPPTGEEEECVTFVTVSVFDLAQTEGEPPPELPRSPLTGESHAHLVPGLVSLAGSLGYTVSFGPVPGAADGLCDECGRRIFVRDDVPGNRRLPHLEISSLLIEVDAWTGSTERCYRGSRFTIESNDVPIL